MVMPLDPNKEYTSPNGRPFRVSGVSKVENTNKWIGGEEKHYWNVSIVYLDQNERIILTYDHFDKLVAKKEL